MINKGTISVPHQHMWPVVNPAPGHFQDTRSLITSVAALTEHNQP